jgi:hypothetical protein
MSFGGFDDTGDFAQAVSAISSANHKTPYLVRGMPFLPHAAVPEQSLLACL